MSEAATTNDIVDTLLSVREGDRLTLEAEGYEWASPFEVAKVNEELFKAPSGDVWKARRVTLASTAMQGSDREFDVYPAAPVPDVGPGYGRLVSVEPVDGEGEDETEASGTSTEDTSTSDVDSESEAEPDVLEENAADDAPSPSTEYLETVNEVLDGDDVQDEITVDAVDDEEESECDCGKTFESQQALQGHGPNSCEADESDDGIDLPNAVTEDLVDELTSGGIEIGDLADELGVERRQARWITHDLGFYTRVREVWRDRDRAQLTVAGWLTYAAVCALTLGTAFVIGVML
ncbi:C2H2-type zinc finger protein [Natrinema pallidum]|uniref:Uncharacterized protein n=1 Tax=Natrinema pallidum TaxID=69527 RepID=A0A4P9TFK1_9EURY|nr:C2H2-type zinc finger protein [Natrinema pallidum]QCW03596.1 hypothetical protein FGF80_10230 [Natrinema pallidum]